MFGAEHVLKQALIIQRPTDLVNVDREASGHVFKSYFQHKYLRQ